MNKFDKILEDVRLGKPVVVVDDENREFEGDIVIAGEKANESNMLFAMTKCGGLLCVPCSRAILERLEVPMMVSETNDDLETPFTVSVDAQAGGTGVSLQDKLRTVKIFCDENAKPEDLRKPGHVFPLKAKDGLLKERGGHTELSIELCKAAGLKSVAVIVEIMDLETGEMAKGENLIKFCEKHDIKIISTEEIREAIY